MEPVELKTYRARIGKAIRSLRASQGLSASAVAKILGVTQSTVSRIENSAASLSAEKLCLLARSFNQPLSFFVGEQSPVVQSEEDIIRAGLVQYGATHLKAKRTIDIREHYANYETFLNAALYEVSDPRLAAALATTLYQQAAANKLNILRATTSIQHVELARYLLNLLELLRKAIPKVERPSRERERVARVLGKLKAEVENHFKATPALSFSVKSSLEISLFINASLKP